MGSTSWGDDILQALLIGLVVQIVVSVLWVFCAFLWAAWEERMARPATGESMTESDVEMGAVSVAEGATIPDNPPHGLAANSGAGDGGKLEDTENTARHQSQHFRNSYNPRIIYPRPSARTPSLKM